MCAQSQSTNVERVVRDAPAALQAVFDSIDPGWRELLSSHPNTLSERDVQLLVLMSQGLTNRQIAAVLVLAESTVKNNISALFDRIGVRDRLQAVIFVKQFGIGSSTEVGPPVPQIAQEPLLDVRDRELLEMLCEGLTNRQIAKEMRLAESTVKNGVSSLFAKIRVHSRTNALVWAYQHGFTLGKTPPQRS